ncbi:carbohydrate ABC transporter permease [Plantibacter sp. CFBP 8798]|uniref:carbohydrate ABC transporter permease n=1 Tax=Plantibacter sp. CFBP 8798 TaxID=2775268 RepID=UPI0017824C29|nr:carbohydrate ABC transporter permease [Plantibacter sp. CFBP 8798]MBD8467353.1 carbohydrate ABC transporter permease [Plantibacter sp. CFBP 8798]
MNSVGGVLGTILLLAWTLVPLLWMLSLAFKTKGQQLASPPQYIPSPATWENFVNVFAERGIQAYIVNSIIVTLVSTPLSVAIAALSAFALARFRFRGQNVLLFSILATRMLPPLIIALPTFVILSRLDATNNLLVLALVYVAFNLPFNIWLLYGFFEEIPKEIEESAQIDGAGSWTLFSRIMLPLVAPGLVAAVIFSSIFAWNEFAFALLLTTTPDAQTLPIAIAGLTSDRGTDFGAMGAVGVIATLPLFAVAVYVQKWLARGLTAGAVKG